MAYKPSTLAFFTGVILVVGGILIWYYTDPSTKLFQLSNDIVGAGLFAAVFGGALRFIGKK